MLIIKIFIINSSRHNKTSHLNINLVVFETSNVLLSATSVIHSPAADGINQNVKLSEILKTT